MKLTKAQRECMAIMKRNGRMKALDSYKPTAALVRLGLARRLSANAFNPRVPSFELSEAGLSALAEQEKEG